jgi:ribosomal protein L11 methyltransferase
MTLLDYGCGSGILALAALKLGARFAYAVDNDPQALMATAANAVLNDAAASLFVGAPEHMPAATVDVLAANILAGPLVDLAPTFAARLVPGGMFVLSGILVPQAEGVAAAYEPYVDDIAQAERDGWVRLTGRRNSG